MGFGGVRLLLTGVFLLEAFEFGDGFGALALESGFLDVEIAKGLFVFQVGFGVDERVSSSLRLIFVSVDEFDGAFEVDSGFEGDDGADEGLFFFGDGAVEVHGAFEAVVFGGVIGGQQAGESGFEGVAGGGGASCVGHRAGAVPGIGSVGGELGFGDGGR